MNRSPAHRRARRATALLLGAGVIWLAYTVVRSRALLAQGRAIESQSASFARDYFVGDADAPAIKYLAMGDSTGAGWGAARLEATYPYLVAQTMAKRGFRVHVVNVARGGATVSDVKANQLADLTKFAPDLITLSVGANDATHFTPTDDYRRDLNAIVSALKQSGARTISVADTPDMWLAPALPTPLSWATARRARAQNTILSELASDSRLQIVPLYARGKLDARLDPDLYAADRFHPSAAGYARWAKLFVSALPQRRHRQSVQNLKGE